MIKISSIYFLRFEEKFIAKFNMRNEKITSKFSEKKVERKD